MNDKNLRDFGIIFGITGIAYALYTVAKMNKICKKIDTTIDDIDKSIAVDIPKSIVERAVNNAVDREVIHCVKAESDRAIKEIRSDIHTQIKKAVDLAYSDIRSDVSDRVSKEVANIDMRALSRDVTKKAEQRIIEKFDSNLDDLLEKFNGELDSVSKIYKSIANKMAGDNNKETILKIS